MPHVRVQFIFEGHDAVPADLVVCMIQDVEKIAFSLERTALKEAVADILQQNLIVPEIADEIQSRFDRLKGASLVARTGDRGAIELMLVGGSLAYWVIKKTIGESFKKADKSSAIDDRLNAFLEERIDEFAFDLMVGLSRQSHRNSIKLESLKTDKEHLIQAGRKQSAKWEVDKINSTRSEDGNCVVVVWATFEEASMSTVEYIKTLDGRSDERRPGKLL